MEPQAQAFLGLAPDPARKPVEDEHLDRALTLLEAAIRRRWEEGLITRDPDGVFTSLLGAEHVERLMSRAPQGQAQLIADHRWDPGSPIGQFIGRLGLSPSESDLLAVLLGAETDPRVTRLVTYLGGNQAQHSLTMDLIFDLVYRARAHQRTTAAALLNGDLSPRRPSRRLRFILVEGAESRSLLAQTVRLHPRVTSWLLGDTGLDAELTGRSRLVLPKRPVGEVDPKLVDAAAAAFVGGGRMLLVDGAQRSGREMLLEFTAAQLGRPLLVVSGRGLTADGLVTSFREAVLQQALIAFRDAEEALAPEAVQRLRECLEVYPGTVALVGAGNSARLLADLRPLTMLRVSVPPHGERLRLWRTYLGMDRKPPPPPEEMGLDDSHLMEISALYNLGVAGIVNASDSARERARFERRPVDRGDVKQAVRQLFDADLSAVATRMEVSQTWDDVVLPDDLGESVVAILDRIRHRTKVLGEWGFARKVGKGLGVTVLFSGEPGTGKSMVAGLIARELGLDLYVVDLGRVTSKWLGETEKNLGRAFDAAEAGHVMLLFDEADSILGKRSEVRTSNDRHANLETNFILARLEQFEGIALFTTNLASAIDAAVSRRMSAHVTFRFPDIEMREELWRRMIPKETPIAGPIDFHQLADKYELSGGFIRNIVLRAAFTAAQEGGGLTMALLERAARAEYADRGSLLVGGRLV